MFVRRHPQNWMLNYVKSSFKAWEASFSNIKWDVTEWGRGVNEGNHIILYAISYMNLVHTLSVPPLYILYILHCCTLTSCSEANGRETQLLNWPFYLPKTCIQKKNDSKTLTGNKNDAGDASLWRIHALFIPLKAQLSTQTYSGSAVIIIEIPKSRHAHL